MTIPGDQVLFAPDPSGGIPAGAVLPYGGTSAPPGWLLCDGSVVARADYPALFSVVSTAFNTGGEAGTDFRLPNAEDMFLVGAGNTYSVGDTGGEATHTLTEAELPTHAHGVGSLANGDQTVNHVHGVGTLAAGNQSASHTHSGTTSGQSATHTHNSGTLAVPAFFSNPTDATVTGAAERMRTASPSVGASVTGNTGNASGDHTHTVTTGNQSASHTHTLSGATGNQSLSHQHIITGDTANVGSGTAHENRPPFLGLTMIIKY